MTQTSSQSALLQYNNPAGEEVDLPEILLRVAQRKWFIFLTTVLAVLLALAYIVVTPPVHKVEALVHIDIEPNDKTPGTLPGTEIQMLQSRSLIQKAISGHIASAEVYNQKPPYLQNLKGIPFLGGFIPQNHRNTSLLLKRFNVPEKWNGQEWRLLVQNPEKYTVYNPQGNTYYKSADNGALINSHVGSIEVTGLDASVGSSFTVVPYGEAEFIERLQSMLAVDYKTLSAVNVIKISMEHHDQAFALNFVDALIEEYMAQAYDRRAKGIKKALKFLETRVQQDSAALEFAELKLREFQEKHDYSDLSRDAEITIKQLSDAQAHLVELQIAYQQAQELYTNEHPNYKIVQSQIKAVKANIRELESKISEMPYIQQQLIALKREVERYSAILRDNYNRINQLRIDAAGITSYAKVLDAAKVLPGTVWPKAGPKLVLAATIGFLIGLVWVVFSQSIFFAKATSAKEVKKRLGLPVYAAIPHGNGNEKIKRKIPVKLITDEKSPSYKSLHAMAASMEFFTRSAKNNIIAITSDAPGQGKTFTAVNLAAITAGRQRTLLVDANLGHPDLNKVFDTALSPGLSGAIIGKHSTDEAIREVVPGKFWLLPAGLAPPNEEVLLSHPRFNQIMGELSKQFDVVIVDYPHQSTNNMNPSDLDFAGNTLLVVHYKRSILQVRRFLDLFTAQGGTVNGIVLNNIFDLRSTKVGKLLFSFL